jgi:Ca2+-dependent lipid-binding protein
MVFLAHCFVNWLVPVEPQLCFVFQRSSSKVEAGWIELVIIEARDLVAADLRGTSDPYVRVHYGNNKKRTKVR